VLAAVQASRKSLLHVRSDALRTIGQVLWELGHRERSRSVGSSQRRHLDAERHHILGERRAKHGEPAAPTDETRGQNADCRMQESHGVPVKSSGTYL
jgi:hypothetical protein